MSQHEFSDEMGEKESGEYYKYTTLQLGQRAFFFWGDFESKTLAEFPIINLFATHGL